MNKDTPIYHLPSGRLTITKTEDTRILLAYTTRSASHYCELTPEDAAWLIQTLQMALRNETVRP